MSWPTSRQAHYSLFVLTIVVMLTVLDRQILALMIEPVKADFGISDTQAAVTMDQPCDGPYGMAYHFDWNADRPRRSST